MALAEFGPNDEYDESIAKDVCSCTAVQEADSNRDVNSLCGWKALGKSGNFAELSLVILLTVRGRRLDLILRHQ